MNKKVATGQNKRETRNWGHVNPAAGRNYRIFYRSSAVLLHLAKHSHRLGGECDRSRSTSQYETNYRVKAISRRTMNDIGYKTSGSTRRMHWKLFTSTFPIIQHALSVRYHPSMKLNLVYSDSQRVVSDNPDYIESDKTQFSFCLHFPTIYQSSFSHPQSMCVVNVDSGHHLIFLGQI